MVAVEFLSGSRRSHQLSLRTVVFPDREKEKLLHKTVSVITSCGIGVGGKADSLCQGHLSFMQRNYCHMKAECKIKDFIKLWTPFSCSLVLEWENYIPTMYTPTGASQKLRIKEFWVIHNIIHYNQISWRTSTCCDVIQLWYVIKVSNLSYK